MRILSIVCMLLLVLSPSWAQDARAYWSPDGALKAVVSADARGESKVEIQTTSARTLIAWDGTSGDGSHGQRILHAAWTADSQFFVVATENSGGHQPWARPIWIYSRSNQQILELTKMGATPVTDFTLKPPDLLCTKVQDCQGRKGELASRPLVVRLHEIVSNGRLSKLPCPAR